MLPWWMSTAAKGNWLIRPCQAGSLRRPGRSASWWIRATAPIAKGVAHRAGQVEVLVVGLGRRHLQLPPPTTQGEAVTKLKKAAIQSCLIGSTQESTALTRSIHGGLTIVSTQGPPEVLQGSMMVADGLEKHQGSPEGL